MKSTILLTTAIFLASAPAPDSKTIAELSADFLSPADEKGLMAAEPETDKPANTVTGPPGLLVLHQDDEELRTVENQLETP